MRFLDGIPATRKEELLKQLKAVWTHDSTAIEGNTLTLGDTMFVLEYGLTSTNQSVPTSARTMGRTGRMKTGVASTMPICRLTRFRRR